MSYRFFIFLELLQSYSGGIKNKPLIDFILQLKKLFTMFEIN